MKHLKSQRGVALPVVLLFIIVLLILGFALSVFGYYESTSAEREQGRAQAYYIARGSISALARYLTTVPSGLTAEELEAYKQTISDYVSDIVSTSGSEKFASGSLSGGTYQLKVEQFNDFVAETGNLTLTSVGTSGRHSKSVAVQLFYQLVEYMNDGPFGIVDSALYVMEYATSKGKPSDWQCDITGDVKTYQDDLSRVLVDVVTGTGGKFAGVKRLYGLPNEPYFPAFSALEYRSAGFQSGAYGDFACNDINISSATIYNTKNDHTPTYIRCRNLRIQKPLYFNGDGPVYILVENSLDFGASIGCTSTCGVTHTANCWLGRVNIIYTGTTDIKITGNCRIRANIISLQAGINGIDIELGGNVLMSGHVICGGDNIWLHGSFENVPSLIYAPSAYVEISGSAGDFYGAIVSDSFYANADFDITYRPIPRTSLPIWFDEDDDEGNLGDGAQIGTGEYYPTNFSFMRWL